MNPFQRLIAALLLSIAAFSYAALIVKDQSNLGSMATDTLSVSAITDKSQSKNFRS